MNEDIKKMATLLKTGHTMLNRACPICNNPIFRNPDGLTFCPACNREVIIVDEDSNQNNKSVKKQENISLEENNKKQIQKEVYIDETKKIVIEKINLICQKLQLENQINLIADYSETLLRLLKILEKIAALS